MKTTIDMAREAGLLTWLKPPEDVIERFNAFESLVRADERAQALAAQPAPEQYTALEQALTRLQKRYAELEAKSAAQRQPLTEAKTKQLWEQSRCAVPRYQMFKALVEQEHGITEKGQP
jgi:hypothetical protein